MKKPDAGHLFPRPPLVTGDRDHALQEEYLLLAQARDRANGSVVLEVSFHAVIKEQAGGEVIETSTELPGRRQRVLMGDVRDAQALMVALEQWIPRWWAYRKTQDDF